MVLASLRNLARLEAQRHSDPVHTSPSKDVIKPLGTKSKPDLLPPRVADSFFEVLSFESSLA